MFLKLEIDVLPSKNKENLEVAIHHHVNVSKLNGLVNFRDYLESLYIAFEKKYTTTMHQLITNPSYVSPPSVFQKKED